MKELNAEQIDVVGGAMRISSAAGWFFGGALLGGVVGAFAAGGATLGAGAPLGAVVGGAVGGVGGLVVAWFAD